MNGNITKEGMKLDIDWMNRAGIGGFQNFHTAFATPQLVTGSHHDDDRFDAGGSFRAMALVQDHPYLAGEFVWTAMDYLG